MSAAYFIIAILGCGEAEAQCQTVRTLETRYESREACTQASDAEAMRNGDVDFPVVVAQCLAADAPPARLSPGEVTLPKGGRAPAANSPIRIARLSPGEVTLPKGGRAPAANSPIRISRR